MLRTLVLLAALALWPGPAPAQDRAEVEQQFRTWLEEVVWPRAQAQGVSRGTFDEAFAGVALNWDLPDLVPPGAPAQAPQAQSQAEFRSPGDYFGRGSVEGAASEQVLYFDLPRMESYKEFVNK